MRAPVAIALLASAFVLSACGGGGGPSKAEYITRADRICRAARLRAAPLVKQVTAAGIPSSPSASRKLAGVTDRLHSLQARYLAQLHALDEPGGDNDSINAFLTPAGRVVDGIGTASGALARGDVTTTMSLLTQAQSAAREARNGADAYGFKDCGSALALVA